MGLARGMRLFGLGIGNELGNVWGEWVRGIREGRGSPMEPKRMREVCVCDSMG